MADKDILQIVSGHQAFASAATAHVSRATFNQTANSTTATVVPAAVNVGSLVLLGDVITAIGTLQTAINANRQLINQIIDIMQANGDAS